MVVPSPAPLIRSKKTRAFGIPIIDLSLDRYTICEQIVKASEEYGFFKVVNHGVSKEMISKMEKEGLDFFAKPLYLKQQAGPAIPFGYGCKNIGFKGDQGELEYILLEADSQSIVERSKSISNNPKNFSCNANDYVEAVKKLACEILELVAEGLRVKDKSIFSKLIRDVNSDSCFRINHYPSITTSDSSMPNLFDEQYSPNIVKPTRIGFGEHSDPQILTILRSNDVSGLQICSRDGLWVPVPPDPNQFFVFVGDALQALTNGRLLSVIHRALAYSVKPRMSMMYFGAPPLDACLSPVPEFVSSQNPRLYRNFTWREYKNAAYCSRLADRRLDLFKNQL